jgi:hypothetical protein
MKGINNGHHLKTNDYTVDKPLFRARMKQEMLEILARGYDSIRIDYPQFPAGSDWQNDAYERRKDCVKIALELGFSQVVWGVVHMRPAVSAASFSSSRSFILTTLLPWAEGVNDSRLVISLGNEEETHADGTTITPSQLRSNLLALAVEAKQVYTKGQLDLVVSVDSCYGSGDVWADNNVGVLDRLGVNIYKGVMVDFAGFTEAITALHNRFGSKLYCAEFNTGNGFSDMTAYGNRFGEELYVRANLDRREILESYDIPWYFFGYGASSDASNQPNAFALRRADGSYRRLWYAL